MNPTSYAEFYALVLPASVLVDVLPTPAHYLARITYHPPPIRRRMLFSSERKTCAPIQPAINEAPPSSETSILQRRGATFINTGNIPTDPVASLRFTLFPALL